jgi:hypothetical protein
MLIPFKHAFAVEGGPFILDESEKQFQIVPDDFPEFLGIVFVFDVKIVFVPVKEHYLAVREDFYIQIIIDVFNPFLIQNIGGTQIAVIIDVIVSEHADDVEPMLLIEKTDCRFARLPAPAVTVDDINFVV